MDIDEYSCSDASVDEDDESECDFGDIDMGNDDEVVPSSSASPELAAQVIKPECLPREIDEMVSKAVAVMGIPPSIGKVILHAFAWDTEKLFEKFYEAESPEAFLKKYKIDVPKTEKTEFVVKKGECMICFEKKNRLIGLSCEHLFCDECWNSYLLMRFRSEGDPFVSCPDTQCFHYLDEEAICKLLKNPAERDFYKRLLIQSFVNTNSVLQWCPHEKCENVVKVRTSDFCPVSCTCGSTFCFLCAQEWHEPISCQLLNRWVKKYSGDSESMKWVSVNTKDCPKCNAAIEKNGGCNHMSCRNKACGFEFCWFCMEDWKKHGYNNTGCNKFKENVETDQASKFREQLRRYMHYYDRFANHRKSLQAETELLIQTSTKIEQMQSQAFSWIETQFLRDAVQILQTCRRSLMFSYAFAYYLTTCNSKYIFEDNQNDLEHATEELSGLLEREIDLDKDDINDLKRKVQDKYRYVDQRRIKMLQHCAEGFDNNEWKFNSDE